MALKVAKQDNANNCFVIVWHNYQDYLLQQPHTIKLFLEHLNIVRVIYVLQVIDENLDSVDRQLLLYVKHLRLYIKDDLMHNDSTM